MSLHDVYTALIYSLPLRGPYAWGSTVTPLTRYSLPMHGSSRRY